MDRRLFLRRSGLTVGGLAAMGLTGCSDTEREDKGGTRTLERIGLQLYTVRSLMEQDVGRTLEQVADIGYVEVEFAGYFGQAPQATRALLDGSGLAAPAGHVALEDMQTNLGANLELANVVGHEYLIVPWLAPHLRSSLDDYRRLAHDLNTIGEACLNAGIHFGYHNQEVDFVPMNGSVPYDVLLAKCEPELVRMELDLFWVAKGGGDPLRYLTEHAGRFDLCHVKDLDQAGAMVDVGEGDLDFAAHFAAGVPGGMTHFFVEHDEPGDPLASIRASYGHLQELRF